MNFEKLKRIVEGEEMKRKRSKESNLIVQFKDWMWRLIKRTPRRKKAKKETYEERMRRSHMPVNSNSTIRKIRKIMKALKKPCTVDEIWKYDRKNGKKLRETLSSVRSLSPYLVCDKYFKRVGVGTYIVKRMRK